MAVTPLAILSSWYPQLLQRNIEKSRDAGKRFDRRSLAYRLQVVGLCTRQLKCQFAYLELLVNAMWSGLNQRGGGRNGVQGE